VVASEDVLRRPVTPGRGNMSRDYSRDNFHAAQHPPSSKWEPILVLLPAGEWSIVMCASDSFSRFWRYINLHIYVCMSVCLYTGIAVCSETLPHCSSQEPQVQASPNFCCILPMPSVLWRCWLGVTKSIRPVKTEWWGAGVPICLEQGADCLHMVQVMNPDWF